MKNKRFIFGTIAIICVSVVAVKLEYTGDIYLKLVGTITGLFIVSQSYTDSQKIKKEKE